MEVMRTSRCRFYPTPEQRDNLARTFGCARFVYNWGLEDRTNAYHADGTSLNYAGQWFSFAAIALIGVGALIVTERRRAGVSGRD